jgi:hypothetical protein
MLCTGAGGDSLYFHNTSSHHFCPGGGYSHNAEEEPQNCIWIKIVVFLGVTPSSLQNVGTFLSDYTAT